VYPEDLREFLQRLEQADQLRRISVPVDPQLELAAIIDRVCKGSGGGRALLFEQVVGGRMPVAANLFGSPERVGWALGTTELELLAARLAGDLTATGEHAGGRALAVLAKAPEWQPVLNARPPCREVDHSALGLEVFPAIKAWPKDGGTFLTLPQVYSRHPDGEAQNCGMYRIQCHDRHTATVRCRPGSGAGRHLAAWHERGMAMPVAVALGGAPILSWAASAPLPDDVGETAFCGYLLGTRLTMSRCLTSDLLVPATAETVIEGVIEPGDFRREGPFGNHTGGYDGEAVAPVLRVLRVHARHEAIFPWTLVGPPPMENIQLMRASEQLFLPLVRMALPTLRGLHLPSEGIFHRAALITVDPSEERPLTELAGILNKTLLLRESRLLVIGVADHDPHDPAAVFWRALNRVDWSRDLLVDNGRLAIDARRLPAGEVVRGDARVMQKVLDRWREYAIDG
jgi:4-hydroxy-3-polyprenylbenzoate decarboxylase